MNKSTEKEFHTVRGYQLKHQNESRLTPALEDYLEMTYRLCLEDECTRINKLSKNLHVRPSSASKMVSKLVELGLLKYDKHDNIQMTEEGNSIGAYLLERHYIIERFFSMIESVNPLEETELVEHMLCPSTVFRIKALVEVYAQEPLIKQQLHSFIESLNSTKT